MTDRTQAYSTELDGYFAGPGPFPSISGFVHIVSRMSVYVKHTRNSVADVLNHPMKNDGRTHGTALLAVQLHGVCQTSELTLELRLVFQHGEVGLLEDLLYISLPLPRRLLVHAEISVAQRLRANPCRVQHIVRIVRVLVAVPVRA